jgi:hypothetical protein
VRIERSDHAGDGVGQQLLVRHLLHVVALDQAIDIGQLAQFVQRQGRLDALLRHRRELDRGRHAGDHAEADQAEVLEFVAHCCS